jgi:acyl-coenzyme A synthetase/AMP-(fatty) acid ligase
MNNEQMQIVDIEQILMAGAMEDVGEKGNPVFFYQINVYMIYALYIEIYVSCQSASLIICTSGTTGHQKAVLHTHASLVGGLQALINWDTNRSNKFLQIGASSWIIHVLEIFFPLVTIPVGTLVLLRPGDHLNMARFCMVIKDKQITNLMIGSTLLKTLLDYLELDKNRFEQMLTGLRIICLTGESLKPQHLVKLKSMAPQTRIFMSYGQTEVLGAIGCYLEYNVSELGNLNVLPIGYPPLGCQCILVDESNERIIPSSYPDELGQIHIRGNMSHLEKYF